MLNGLGICSGIGGLERSLESWVEFIAHCEREPYPAGVLLGKTGIPCWDDLRTFPWADFKGRVDIVAAGFPCQDVSEVGAHAGMAGERSTLVFDIIRGCSEIDSEFIFLENVPPVTKKMGWEIARCLARYGYDARWLRLFVPAECPIGEGQRWFLLAKAQGQSRDEADTQNDALRNQTDSGWWWRSWKTNCLPGWDKMAAPEWEIPSRWLLRDINGLPGRVDAVRALGNAVVSEQARQAFQILSGVEMPAHTCKPAKEKRP